MEEDQIVITLTKKGAGKSPDYYLELKEDGTVGYDGKENVKVIGKIKTSIVKIKFLELLAEFRNLNFFSLRDDYSITDDPNQPRTIISISIPIQTSEVRTKTVTYFQKDPTIPDALRTIENKIHEVVDFNQLRQSFVKKDIVEEKKEIEEICQPEPIQKIEQVPLKKEEIKEFTPSIEKTKPPQVKKINSKKSLNLYIVLIVIILIIVISFLIGSNYFINRSSSNGGGIPDFVDNEPINISKFVTASEVIGLGNYVENDTFTQGDTIFAYLEYNDYIVDDTGDCNLTLKIIVNEINGDKSYMNSFNENNANKIEHHWMIITDDSWNPGSYYIVVYITDNLSNELASKDAAFSIIG